MTQLDPTRYKRLTKSITYGQSDGLYWDGTNSRLVVCIADTVYEAPLHLSSQAQGEIIRRGASAWEVHDANDSGRILVGDGTDLVSVAVSGDAALASSGALTLANPQRLLSSTVNLTKDLIVGNAAGDIGHAGGVTLVAAVAAKIIAIDSIVINYTRATDTYGGGGDISAKYLGGAAVTGTCSAANSLGAAASNINALRALSGLALVNTAVVLVAGGAFTDPGTAAGTAVVKTYYRLIDA